MIEMEQALINAHHWSLKDIDETDMESLIRYLFYEKPEPQIYCDQVEFL